MFNGRPGLMRSHDNPREWPDAKQTALENPMTRNTHRVQSGVDPDTCQLQLDGFKF